jgi:hypothetical protein
MIIESNSISATGYHAIIGKALELQVKQYTELWNEVQEFGATTVGKCESDRWRLYFEKFGFRVDTSRLIITVLTCSFLEALANFYIASKTDANQFAVLERASILEKWVTIPRFYNPRYELPKDEQLYQDLKLVITSRNAITHPKPLVVVDGANVHKGNIPKKSADEHAFTLRSASLPMRLLKHLWKYDQSRETNLLIFSCGYDLMEFNAD